MLIFHINRDRLGCFHTFTLIHSWFDWCQSSVCLDDAFRKGTHTASSGGRYGECFRHDKCLKHESNLTLTLPGGRARCSHLRQWKSCAIPQIWLSNRLQPNNPLLSWWLRRDISEKTWLISGRRRKTFSSRGEGTLHGFQDLYTTLVQVYASSRKGGWRQDQRDKKRSKGSDPG